MRPLWPLLLALALVALPPGCIDATESSPAPRPQDAHPNASPTQLNLSRAELETQRIEIHQPEPGWSARHLTIQSDMWSGTWNETGGHASLNTTLILEPETNADPVLGIAFHLQPPEGTSLEPYTGLQLAAFNDTTPQTLPVTATTSCSGEQCPPEPPALSYSFILGTMAKTATLSIAFPNQTPAQPEPILAREPLPIGPDHQGNTIQAGTHIQTHAPNQAPEGWTAGYIQTSQTGGATGPYGLTAAHTYRTQTDSQLSSNGTLQALFAGAASAEATPWSLDWTLSNNEGKRQGLHVRTGPVSNGQTPFFVAQTEPGPGPVRITMERTITGKQTPTLPTGQALPGSTQTVAATWGWFDNSLEKMYGWNLTEIIQASGTSPEPAPPTASVRVQTCLHDDLCLADTPTRTPHWAPPRHR